MYISLHYRYCVNGAFSKYMRWDTEISQEQYDSFLNARRQYKDEYDKLNGVYFSDAERDAACFKLNYKLAEGLFNAWCGVQKEMIRDNYNKIFSKKIDTVNVCVDGCEVLEGAVEEQPVDVVLGYTVNFGKGDVSDFMTYDTVMSHSEYELLLNNKPEVDIEKEVFDLNDVAMVLPNWAEKAFNDIVDRETVKFRREPYYEIWGFTKEEIDAPDWKITSIADIYVTVESVGQFLNL